MLLQADLVNKITGPVGITVVIWIVSAVIIARTRTAWQVVTPKGRMIAMAKKMGHEFTPRFERTDTYHNDDGSLTQLTILSYVVNGKKYLYSSTLKVKHLYYINNPNHAFDDNNRSALILSQILPFLIAVFVYNILK